MASLTPAPIRSKRLGHHHLAASGQVQAEWCPAARTCSSVPTTPTLTSRRKHHKHRVANGVGQEKVLCAGASRSQNGLDGVEDVTAMASRDAELDQYNLLQSVKNRIPVLSSSLRKGECGKIAIFGGCVLYTGAAYYCGVAALRTGADSAHVFCDAAAASVIRGYTTELVIHPVLDQEYGMEEVDAWLPRMDCVVVGPGLGKNQSMLGRISLVLQKTVALNIPVIVDGDGLWHIVHQPATLTGYTRAVVTPNTVELDYLHHTFCGPGPSAEQLSAAETCSALAAALGHVTIVAKGGRDIVTNGRVSLGCSTPGSPKRCDGQGHILSGLVAAFLHWSLASPPPPASSLASSSSSVTTSVQLHRPVEAAEDADSVVRAGWAACHLARSAAAQAFSCHGRAASAQDIIACIGPQFQKIFDGGTMI